MDIMLAKTFFMRWGYPDLGCSEEVYTSADVLELETVDALETLNPSESIQHTEIWKIFNIGELTPEPDGIKNKLDVLLNKWIIIL